MKSLLHAFVNLTFLLCSCDGFLSYGSTGKTNVQKYNIDRRCSQLCMRSDLVESLQREITSATGEDCSLEFGYSGSGGGGGASVGMLKDKVSGKQYFYKSTNLMGYEMLRAEYEGIKAMHETQTIKVPEPICKGTSENNAFVVFEYLNMGGGGSMKQMGEELAAMHRNTSPNGKFGFHIDNTCGATPQPNAWEETWADFYCKHRLAHMMTLCERDGAHFPDKEELLTKVHRILSEHNPIPSLVHGDLWGGNKGFADGKPVIFDPATYYGDREVDIAMSYLFGAFGSDFYTAYDRTWPMPPGFEQRKVIYNLYHILNHYVLFGGSYINQAQGMISRIMSF